MCFISFIFILMIAGAVEGDKLTIGQAIVPLIYGMIMFYHTSKKYWSKGE